MSGQDFKNQLEEARKKLGLPSNDEVNSSPSDCGEESESCNGDPGVVKVEAEVTSTTPEIIVDVNPDFFKVKTGNKPGVGSQDCSEEMHEGGTAEGTNREKTRKEIFVKSISDTILGVALTAVVAGIAISVTRSLLGKDDSSLFKF